MDALDAECRERSATVRLIGCGKEHTVAVLSNGELYMWGRASFGKLGRTKKVTGKFSNHFRDPCARPSPTRAL